jgi:DNA-binding CsgD family transcriptional regulator
MAMESLGQRKLPVSASIVGRESELSALEQVVVRGGAARSLVLFGEAGIGKTTLWEAGVELARSRGSVVLSARASEAEARLSFAGLADLLDGVDASAMTELPAPQSQALEVAVGRRDPGGVTAEPLAISTGFLGVLRALARAGPVLVAVDDVQSLDRPSAELLAFAARRIGGSPVGFLLSRRGSRPTALEEILELLGIERIEVCALSFGATNVLLSGRLRQVVPRRVLRQLFEASQGNPLFALELGRALLERGMPEFGSELPVPDRLADVFGARIDQLSGPVRRVLLAVALSPGLSPGELAAVVDHLAMTDALAVGLVVVDRSVVRVGHPLLAAAATARSSAAERRELHVALADSVTDRILRARHLALASGVPDAKLAAEVAAAVVVAAERGAIQDAVELATHALRLTPEDAVEHTDRLLDLAQCLATAGDYPRVTELLGSRLDTLRGGRARATAHILLGAGALKVVEEEWHLAQAVAAAVEDPELRATALSRSSILRSVNYVERIAGAEGLARDSLSAARSAGAELEPMALVALAWALVMGGRPVDELGARSVTASVGQSMYTSEIDRPLGVRLAFRGQLDEARVMFSQPLARADERGDARFVAVVHAQLCELELRAGDAFAATRLLDEWDLWTIPCEDEMVVVRERLQALLAAVRGVPALAARWAASVLEACDLDRGSGWDRLEATRAAGIGALLEHDAEGAVALLGAVWDHTVREGVDDPGAFPVAPDLVEALIESGDVDGALSVINRLDRLATEQQSPWGLATVQRCRAMVALSSSYEDEAAAALSTAAVAYERWGLWLDQARALLYLGRAQRRFRKRADARRSLEQATSSFDRLGCDGWAQLARAELGRVSGRAPAEAGDLTPSERRAVELAAGGLSNKEIAGQLFVSVYTVEAHLKHAYAKLGVRSRGQLAQRLADLR